MDNFLDECNSPFRIILPRFWLSSQVNKGGYDLEHIERFKRFAQKMKNQNPNEDIREYQIEVYLKEEFDVDVTNTYKETKVIFKNSDEYTFFNMKL